MADNAIHITAGIAPTDLARFRGVLGRIARADEKLRIKTREELVRLTDELERALKYEFRHAPTPNKAGRRSHDRTGADDDPSLWNPDYKHTVDQIEVEIEGFEARITLGGGAVFVEYGSSPHTIPAASPEGLIFRTTDDEWVRTQEVEHPGYTGDKFVERAFRDIDLHQSLARLFTLFQVDVFGWAANAEGEQFTQGQQFT